MFDSAEKIRFGIKLAPSFVVTLPKPQSPLPVMSKRTHCPSATPSPPCSASTPRSPSPTTTMGAKNSRVVDITKVERKVKSTSSESCVEGNVQMDVSHVATIVKGDDEGRENYLAIKKPGSPLLQCARIHRSWSYKPTLSGQPNYFVSLRVDDSALVEMLSGLQTTLTEFDARYAEVITPMDKMHISLMVMRLDEFHCLHDVGKALDKVVDVLAERRLTSNQSLSMNFKGVQSFNNRVVYVSPDEETQHKLKSVAQVVTECMREEGIASTEREGSTFTPHLSVAKMSMLKRGGRHSKHVHKKGDIHAISPKAYRDMLEKTFGVQTAFSLEVCKMSGGFDEIDCADGYYYTPLTVPFA